MSDRAICTVAAFMIGVPVPPPGLAQKVIAATWGYKFRKWS